MNTTKSSSPLPVFLFFLTIAIVATGVTYVRNNNVEPRRVPPTPIPVSAPKVVSAPAIDTSNCFEDDGGNKPYVRSSLRIKTPTTKLTFYQDYCINSFTLERISTCHEGDPDCYTKEFYCDNGFLAEELYFCEFGCDEGQCRSNADTVLNHPEIIDRSPAGDPGDCMDSDGGKEATLQGQTSLTVNGMQYATYIDTCIDTGFSSLQIQSCSGSNCYVRDHYCQDGKRGYTHILCPQGCEDGACIIVQ